jgi:hypothetical protein
MTAKKTFVILNILLALLGVSILGGAYQVQQILKTESLKLASSKAKLVAYQKQQTQLLKAKKDIATYSDLFKISKVIVPENKNQAEAIRQIINIAKTNNISIESITFPTSNLGSASTGAGGGTDKSQLVAVKNIPGVYDLKLLITSDQNAPVSFQQLIAFLADLENNRQTALVSNISLVPDNKSGRNPSIGFNITLDTYIKP